MAKMVAFPLAILFMALMASLGHGLPDDDQSPEAVEKWHEPFPHGKPQNLKLRLYLNNILTDVPPASVAVAKASTTDSSQTSFGLVRVIDGPMTEQPMTEHRNAKVIARVQGLGVFSSHTEVGILEAINFVFTDGKFKGSTISAFGRLAPAEGWNDITIIGGSGDFLMAQGTIKSRIYFIDPTIGDVQEMIFDIYSYPKAINKATDGNE